MKIWEKLDASPQNEFRTVLRNLALIVPAPSGRTQRGSGLYNLVRIEKIERIRWAPCQVSPETTLPLTRHHQTNHRPPVLRGSTMRSSKHISGSFATVLSTSPMRSARRTILKSYHGKASDMMRMLILRLKRAFPSLWRRLPRSGCSTFLWI